MKSVDTLYVGWQDDESRRWYPVGKLEVDENGFEFVYLEGARQARTDANFPGVAEFGDFDRVYRSEELFSFFRNRVKSKNRPDAEDEKRRLGFPNPEENLRAFDILSRSYGKRVTDRFEVYPPPRVGNGEISLVFFTRGLRHADEEIQQHWLSDAEPVTPIRLQADVHNDYDEFAQYVLDADGWNMGYLPWYYTESFAELVDAGVDYSITVKQRNRQPAYPQHWFLLHFRADRPADWEFPMSPLYDPADDDQASIHAA